MSRSATIAIGALAVGCFSAHAAECEVRFGAVETANYSSSGFNVFSNSNPAEDWTIELEKVTSADCDLVLTVSSSTPSGTSFRSVSNGAGGEVRYTIASSQNLNDKLPDAAEPGLRSGFLLNSASIGSSRHQVTLYFAPDDPELQASSLSSGTYTDQLYLRLYKSDAGVFELLDERPVSLTIPVASVQEVRVALSDLSFDEASPEAIVNFGELSEGEMQTAFIKVRSTERYSITLDSDHDWSLAGDHESRVPYQVYVNQQLQSTRGDLITVVDAGSTTDSFGDSHEIEFKIEEVRNKAAGKYEDQIVIRVIPFE
jgi:hypothetical protein